MGRAIDALLGGASSAIDLTPPAASFSYSPDAAMAIYWRATGAYLWQGVEVERPLFEAQRPLFDVNASGVKS